MNHSKSKKDKKGQAWFLGKGFEVAQISWVRQQLQKSDPWTREPGSSRMAFVLLQPKTSMSHTPKVMSLSASWQDKLI